MPVRLPTAPKQEPRGWQGPERLWAGLGLTLLAGAAITFAWLPAPLILPMLSVIVIIAATIAAFVAGARSRQASDDRVSYWDIAGALVFIGVCAALLSDPEQVIPLLESNRMH